jgi:putative ABC transport system substrate-binding protein
LRPDIVRPPFTPFRYFATVGGLLSYGIDATDLFHRSASYVDVILKGVKPADLPVQQPTKFDLVINLKTAKVLGLEVPDKLLALVDEVIGENVTAAKLRYPKEARRPGSS